MRLASYMSDDGLRAGLVVGTDVYDVAQIADAAQLPAADALTTVRALLTRFGARLPELSAKLEAAVTERQAAAVGSTDAVTFGAPITDPAKVLCVGLNYRDHVAETGRELPKNPDIFAKFPSSLIGPYDEIALSGVTEKLDYEGELAVVIGQACRNVSVDDALSKLAGAMVMNDTTGRDLQFKGTQWLPGKAIDASTPSGPFLVTLDEVGSLTDLELTTRVNGQQVQHSRTDLLIFQIPEIVAYISRFLELVPGDIITTGTPDGVGSRREPPTFLAAGDVVEVEISRLGSLRNTIR
jgi:2-keto-4-pentenoate hydratase/2-oxohepta-3-ene-1,7-dioic acid hydratase in catechol pathway